MKTYSIKEVGEIMGLTSSTLRYYKDEGILNHVERNETNQRIYTDRHLGILRTLKCFKGTGMSMQQLKQFFLYEEDEQNHMEEILELLCGQREKVLGNIEQLKQDLDKVERKIRYYEDMKTAYRKKEPLPEWADYK